MPIYEYQCPACENTFEQLIRKPSDTPRKCPACGGSKPKKIWSAFSVSAPPAAASPGCEACPRESGCPMGARGCPSMAG